jgi:hypothetical protein
MLFSVTVYAATSIHELLKILNLLLTGAESIHPWRHGDAAK